ncbi:MAG: hypothetical protein ACHQF0_14550 [Chitinophagales bacterium]
MRTKSFSIFQMAVIILLVTFLAGFQMNSKAQNDRSVTVYQFRRVPSDKVDEFVKRETTYWSKVAEKAVKDKTMTFWALLEKVGGYDMPNSSNYLFINTFPDIDKVGNVFGSAEKITGMPLAKIETNSMSTTTSEFYLHDRGWQQAANANPAKDFNYVVMIYHNTNYPDSLISLENNYWGPFVKKAMDNKQTPQMAWGNAMILSPSGDNIKATTVSYDLYKTMEDALMPQWDPKTEFPNDGLGKINAIELNRRGSVIYRVVKVVASN